MKNGLEQDSLCDVLSFAFVYKTNALKKYAASQIVEHYEKVSFSHCTESLWIKDQMVLEIQWICCSAVS
jgi:hypothetical protein